MTDLARRIDQGTGREPADLVLKGGRFFDLVTGELVASDIAICGETIIGHSGKVPGSSSWSAAVAPIAPVWVGEPPVA